MSDHHALRERPQARPHALRTALARATQGVLLGLPLVSWAQQPATPQAGTQTVVVTASRVEQAIEQAPVATSVVTKEDLELGNAMTLDQAVARVPGVFSKRSKGLLDTLGGIQIRGVPDDNRTLVLLDGLPLNDGYTGGIRLGGLSLAEVDRVEVVRGPASSLYGGNAMGGVVQVLTRMPTRTEASLTLTGGGALRSDWGLDGQRGTAFSGGTALDNGLSVRLGLNKRHADGYRSDLVSTTVAPPAAVTGALTSATTTGGSTRLVGERGANEWDEDAASLAVQWRPDEQHRLRLTLARQHYEYGYGQPLSYLQQAGSTVYGYVNGASVLREASFTAGGGQTTRHSAQLRYDGRFGGLHLQATAATIRLGTNQFVTPDATAALSSGGPGRLTNTPSRTNQLDLQADFEPAAGHTTTIGAAWRGDQADITERVVSDWRDAGTVSGGPLFEAHGRSQTRSLFAQDEWTFASAWAATLGLRWDAWKTSDGRADDRSNAGVSKPGFPKVYPERSDSALSPKLGVVFHASKSLSWRASAGRAFRAPATYDLYRTWISSAGTIFVSNPALTPETVRSLDVGLNFKPAPGAEVGITLFRNDLHDLIYRRTVTDLTEARALCGATATTSNCRHFVNAGRARSQGAEFEFRQRLGTFGWFANITALDTVVLENRYAPKSVGKRIVGVPRSIVNAGADVTRGAWTASLAGRSVGKAFRNDDNSDTVEGVYGATDARTVWDAKIAWRVAQAFTVSLAVDNLTDRRFYDFYRGPGRSYTLELSARH